MEAAPAEPVKRSLAAGPAQLPCLALVPDGRFAQADRQIDIAARVGLQPRRPRELFVVYRVPNLLHGLPYIGVAGVCPP